MGGLETHGRKSIITTAGGGSQVGGASRRDAAEAAGDGRKEGNHFEPSHDGRGPRTTWKNRGSEGVLRSPGGGHATATSNEGSAAGSDFRQGFTRDSREIQRK